MNHVPITNFVTLKNQNPFLYMVSIEFYYKKRDRKIVNQHTTYLLRNHNTMPFLTVVMLLVST